MIQPFYSQWLTQEDKNICPYNYFYVNIPCSFIYNSQKLETSQMFINKVNEWTNCGILTIATYNDMHKYLIMQNK